MRCPHSKLAEIDYAKDVLKENGYFVDNLWHIQDVQHFYKCDDAMAMRVLDHVLNGNDKVTYEIWEMIDRVAKNFEIEKKDD